MGGTQHRIEIVALRLFESGFDDGSRSSRDVRGGSSGFFDFFGTEIVAVCVAGALARDHADADSRRQAFGRAFDDAFIDRYRGCRKIFEVEVRILASGREGFVEVLLKVVFSDAESLGEKGLGKPHNLSFTHAARQAGPKSPSQ